MTDFIDRFPQMLSDVEFVEHGLFLRFWQMFFQRAGISNDCVLEAIPKETPI
jgi:hypothetical protein